MNEDTVKRVVAAIRKAGEEVGSDARLLEDREDRNISYHIEQSFKRLANLIEEEFTEDAGE